MDKLIVMVVDDEPGIRSGVSRILSNFTVSYPFMDDDIGFDVIEVETGEEAIEKVKSEHIDIVLLDNKLPGILGTDVLEFISNNKPEILVMMITSYASLELAVKATDHGAYDFIPKPFTPQELKSSLENVSASFSSWYDQEDEEGRKRSAFSVLIGAIARIKGSTQCD